jgi:hypothetical protein
MPAKFLPPCISDEQINRRWRKHAICVLNSTGLYPQIVIAQLLHVSVATVKNVLKADRPSNPASPENPQADSPAGISAEPGS